MTQDEAEEKLTASGNDCFLIRHDRQILILSLSHCEEFHHVKINYGPGWYELENGSAEYSFLGLDDLIDYYQNNPLSKLIDVQLDQTCDRILTKTSKYCLCLYDVACAEQQLKESNNILLS